MVKKISVLALAGMLALPTFAMAAGGTDVADLEKKINELSRQLDELRGAMAAQAEQNKDSGRKCRRSWQQCGGYG